MFVQAYIDTAIQLVQHYTGDEPFPSFVKKFFALHKKFGSRDRKQITHLCFCYFRLGRSLPDVNKKERFLIGLFLCSSEKNAILETLKPLWNHHVSEEVEWKIRWIQQEVNFCPEDILLLKEEVSNEIDYSAFAQSFLVQPDVFLRIRPGKTAGVKNKLSAAHIPFQEINEHCISVSPATKIDQVLQLNKEAVLQDISSQQVLLPLLSFLNRKKSDWSVWDCCAASGGKSLLLRDSLPNIRLTVSDIRPSILINLRKRFQQAGIHQYKSFVADVSAPGFLLSQQFDIIICDVPCTGSGTWARTPEQLYFFNGEKINRYASLQQQIVQNACKSLAPEGWLLYCTCSVFKKENEEVVNFIQHHTPLQLLHQQYLKGYHQKADVLFTALFALP